VHQRTLTHGTFSSQFLTTINPEEEPVIAQQQALAIKKYQGNKKQVIIEHENENS